MAGVRGQWTRFQVTKTFQNVWFYQGHFLGVLTWTRTSSRQKTTSYSFLQLPEPLAQCLAPSRFSTNICWVSRWMGGPKPLPSGKDRILQQTALCHMLLGPSILPVHRIHFFYLSSLIPRVGLNYFGHIWVDCHFQAHHLWKCLHTLPMST